MISLKRCVCSLPTDKRTKSTSRKGLTRRGLVLRSLTLFSVVGTDDPTTLINGVLSGYGLPTIKAPKGLKAYDRLEDDFTFDYPKSWVIVKNTFRKGVYISDFKTADKITVEMFPHESMDEGSLALEVVKKFIAPGRNQQDDRLELPALEKIRHRSQKIDKLEYVYIDFPSSTITRSGYQVRRLNTAVATQKDSIVYALCASTRSEQASEEKAKLFEQVIESFRVQ